ncbi:hypothetical protein [Piscinibacter sp.]|uniref:hypothetical protein n=1 Tax=Piscinibacter sp. TaxID=1903157 RepID=UPI0039E4584A
MNTSTRLRLATRIHFALLRHYGHKVEIGDLMKAGGEVREAIWVCEASGDAELAAMARQLREAGNAPQTPGRVPQDTAWADDTSGFGVSRPVEFELDGGEPPPSSWLKPSTWARRGGAPRQG